MCVLGGGPLRGSSCDYLRTDTLAMKVSKEGACTVSWGKAFQSFTVLGRKKGELPEVSALGVLLVGPVVSSSRSCGLMLQLKAPDSSKSADNLVEHTCHISPMFHCSFPCIL